MKNFKLYFLALMIGFVSGCSQDDVTGNRSDGIGGSLAIFALKGDYLYTVDQQKLNVFSVQNLGQPVKVNDMVIGFDIETLFSYEDYLFVGSRNGMFIYSIANPENPQRLSSVSHFTACDPVVANATHSFVTLHSNTMCGNNVNVLQVYENTDLTSPQLIHSRNLVAPKGLGLYGDYLIVCDDVIKIFDIRNPEEPTLAKTINRFCFDVIIKGDDLFAIGEEGLYRYQLDPSAIENIILQSEINF